MSCILAEWGFPFFSVPGRAATPYLDAVRNAQLRETGVFIVDRDDGRGCFTEFVRTCAHYEIAMLDTYLSVLTDSDPALSHGSSSCVF